MTSFFEISGEVIACELDATERSYGRPSPRILSSLFRESSASGATRSTTDTMIDIVDETGLSLAEALAIPGRLRRATTALTWAGTLALADGPLPFGDALAVGVLAGYSIYEISSIFRDYQD